jgi:hypothetical protein
VQFLPALSLPETAAEAYGAIRAELETRGEMIENNDLWIAAHAVVARLTLVTNNECKFRRVIHHWPTADIINLIAQGDTARTTIQLVKVRIRQLPLRLRAAFSTRQLFPVCKLIRC